MTEFEQVGNFEVVGLRIFFYLRSGLSILNEFKNLIMFVFGIYFTLKLDAWWWLLIMFMISLPILSIVGYLFVMRWNKLLEYFSVKDGTFYSVRNFQIQEEILTTLKELKDK